LPDLIVPEHAADQNRHYKLTLSQQDFPRLMEVLVGEPRPVEVDLRFFTEPETGFPAFKLHLRSDFELECQRTLEPYQQPVNECLNAVFVASEGAADIVPDAYEPWLLEQEKINPWQLIEDELLLAIPQVPRKPGEPLVWLDDTSSSTSAGVQENPFAALKTLLDTTKKH
jgi:uncharacterized protein